MKTKVQQSMTLREAAEYLEVDKEWLRRNIHKMEIPHFKKGREFRFPKRELDKWKEHKTRMSSKNDDSPYLLVKGVLLI